jgi:hypothetical protein
MTAAMWAFFAGLLCQMALPFCAALPLWVAERFLDIVIGTGKLACHFSWSQKTYAAPPLEILLLFAVFLIGMAAVRHTRLGRYLLAGLIAAALFIPADLLARRLPKRLETVRFAVSRGELLGVRWPDRRVWVIAPCPNRSLPYLIGRHVLPWVRHRAGRIRPHALMVPGDFSATADTVFEKYFRIAPDRLVAFPAADSFMSTFTPCGRCTCSVSRGNKGLLIRIAAPFFDTTLSLDGCGRRKTAGPGACAARSAVIMTAGRKGVRSRDVVPPGHPVW